VLAVVDGTALTLVNALTGASLYNNTANKYYGSPSISNGVLYVGSVSSGLYAFGT
jgi:outer membrane protein assembly factor BamB